jgi:hypothetical protein
MRILEEVQIHTKGYENPWRSTDTNKGLWESLKKYRYKQRVMRIIEEVQIQTNGNENPWRRTDTNKG